MYSDVRLSCAPSVLLSVQIDGLNHLSDPLVLKSAQNCLKKMIFSKEAVDNSSRTHALGSEEEIVISGISGYFPKSRDMKEFAKNLYEKADLLQEVDSLWREVFPELPEKLGKTRNVRKFDATFFGVHYKQAHLMDPSLRFILECAFETILDAGISPMSLRGSKTGVFIGSTFLDMDKIFYVDKLVGGGFAITGCNRAMLANRISYTFDLQGPSMHLDSLSSATLTTFDVAYSAIRNGQCDAAIIGGSNVILHPYITAQYSQLGILSKDGVTRLFDENLDGSTHSEATCCIFLQKAKDAKRIYARVVHSKSNHNGSSEEGITTPSREMQIELLEDFYKEVSINPADVAYVETHSEGTIKYDVVEMEALDEVICRGRKSPLKVGCVKSNIGNTQPCGGICGIAKVIIAIENNSIPPNINFSKPHPELKALVEGRMEIVKDATEIKGNNLIAINATSFTGGNSHLLLESVSKDKINRGEPKDDVPRLITWSGRTEEGVNELFNYISSQPLDAEFVGLVHETQVETVSNNIFRGYGLFQKGADGGNALSLTRDVQHFPGVKRPVVWVFSGMGSQWTQMGSSLMSIPLFRQTIEYCHEVLRPKNIDVIGLLTSDDPTIYDNILNSFVGIAATQIAIVDILRALEMQPDIIIGHSVGELGCAYADGCFTAEEMILSAYSRGKVSVETEKIFGSMAAVGLGYKKVRNLLPPDIEVACRNSSTSSTISGPAKSVELFVADLKKQGIFAKEVPCSNIAYHSRYIADMGPKLLDLLNQVIKKPKKRSAKWLSTSVPQSMWNNEDSQYSSGQYHTNNLTSAVLFEDTFAMIPNHAITIEIAPHGLLQAIIKKSKSQAIHVPLTSRGSQENAQFFLTALGKIYMNGIDFAIQNLYPPIEFPVSRGTPMISPLVYWDHSTDYFVPPFSNEYGFKSGRRFMRVGPDLPEFNFLTNYMMDDKMLFPAMGFIFSVWETFALINGGSFFDTNVEFSNIRFLQDLDLTRERERELLTLIQPGFGYFQICEGNITILSGNVKILEEEAPEENFFEPLSSDEVILNTKDFYKELYLRGYQYKDMFQTVSEAFCDGSGGKVKFQNNWMAFMDSFLQIFTLGQDTRELMLPKTIETIRIWPQEILRVAKENKGRHSVTVCKELKTIFAKGLEIVDLKMKTLKKSQLDGTAVTESCRFIPHLPAPLLSLTNAARVCVQNFLDGSLSSKVKIVEVDSPNSRETITSFCNAVNDLPGICGTLIYLSPNKLSLKGVHVEDGDLKTQRNCNIVIGTKGLRSRRFIEEALKSLSDGGYLISREDKSIEMKNVASTPELSLILFLPLTEETLVVFKRSSRKILPNSTVFEISEGSLNKEWLNKIQEASKYGPVTLLSRRESCSGISGLVNMLRKKIPDQLIHCFSIEDKKFNDSSYKNQVKLSLPTNVYREGKWGSYRNLKVSDKIVSEASIEHCFVGFTSPQDQLAWRSGNLSEESEDQKRLINVAFSGLNLRDKEIVTGELPLENIDIHRGEREMVLGSEFSGMDEKGQRVMGIVRHGALSTQLLADDVFTFSVPDHWTLEEAATVPMSYLTIYWAFFFRIQIKPNKSILIHSGANELGIAAIRVALAYGLNVFTTVDTLEKKKFLLNLFPELKEDQIGSCSDISFEVMIKDKTFGDGVQYVFNTLKAEKLAASVRCLGICGKFLQMRKSDMINNGDLGLGIFLNEVEFQAVEIDRIMNEEYEYKNDLAKLVRKDTERGIIQPIPATIFNANDVNHAFGFFKSQDCIGKVLLKIREYESNKFSLQISISPRFSAQYRASYIIFGGLDGFGFEFTDWLVTRGARKLVLTSHGRSLSNYQLYRMRLWQSYGVQIIYRLESQGSRADCLELLERARELGPVVGIFNTSFCNSWNETEYFEETKQPISVSPTKNLDELTRKLCPNISHFVIFSRRSLDSENDELCNAELSISLVEKIVEERVASGFPGKVIHWGSLEGKTPSSGVLTQKIFSCLDEVDRLLLSSETILHHAILDKRETKNFSILETVKRVLQLKELKSLDTTIKSLAIDYEIMLNLKRQIRKEFDISLSVLNLQKLTCGDLLIMAKDRLHEKEGELILTNGSKPGGLEILLQYLKDRNSSAEKKISRIPSRDQSIKYPSCVLFVPGLVEILETDLGELSLNVSLPVFSLHITEDIGLLSIPELARSLLQDIKRDALKDSEMFYLVGYSFGVFLTLELAALLEQEGMTGQILLIDGAPEFFKLLLVEQLIEDFTEEDVEELIVSNILRIVFPEDNAGDIWGKQRGIKWQDRVERLVSVCRSQYNYSQEYLRYIAEFLYRRVRHILDGSSAQVTPVNSPITLVRPRDVSVVDIERDYGVAQWTRGQFQLRFIDGDHATMLRNGNLSRIINEYDPRLKSLRDFEDYIEI